MLCGPEEAMGEDRPASLAPVSGIAWGGSLLTTFGSSSVLGPVGTLKDQNTARAVICSQPFQEEEIDLTAWRAASAKALGGVSHGLCLFQGGMFCKQLARNRS